MAPVEAASDAQSMEKAGSRHQSASSADPIPGDRARVRVAGVLRATPPGLELTTIRHAAPASTSGATGHSLTPGGRTPRPRMAKRTSNDREPKKIRDADDITTSGVTAMPGATDTTSHPDLRARNTRSVDRQPADTAAADSASAADQLATPENTGAGSDTGEHRILPFERNRDRHEQAGTSGREPGTAVAPVERPSISTDQDHAETARASVEEQASEEANEAARERDGREDGEERPETGSDTTPPATSTRHQPAATSSTAADTAQWTQAAETGATGEAEPDASGHGSAENAHESRSGSISETRDTVTGSASENEDDGGGAASGMASAGQRTAHDAGDRTPQATGNETDTMGQQAAQVASASDTAATNVAETGRQSIEEVQDQSASSAAHARAHSAATAGGVAGTIAGVAHDVVDRARAAAAGVREPAARTAGQVRGVLSGSGAPGPANARPSESGQGGSAISGATQRPPGPLLAGTFMLLTLTGLNRWLVRKLTGADVRVLGPRNVRGKLFGAGLIAMIAGWLLSRED